MTINKKYNDLCKEIKWRFENTDYTEEDKAQVVIHEIIDKDMSFISIDDIKGLSDELGTSKILEIEQSYIEEFGQLTEKAEKDNICKLRLLLYWYFERRVLEDDEMRRILEID
jgi:hypothetical protein